MKKKNLMALVVSLLLSIFALGQGIIIDHNCVDISKIPTQYIDLVKANTKMQWCGQSHSNQGLCGIEIVEGLFPQFDSEHIDLVLPNNPSAMDVYVGNYGFDNPGCCTSITPEGYWRNSGPEWENDLFTHWPGINVSIFNWCYQLQSNNSTYVQQYLAQMEIFEDTYPWCTFVYTTNNAQAWGQEGVTRAENNNMIRQYCIANNKVLFDFADLDSWYNGVHATTVYNGTTFEVQHTAYDCSSCCGHVNDLGSEQKGRAIWWLAARLQGWDPTIVQGLDILVDHNSTDYQSIPIPVIDDVQANIKFHYAHYSHGSQLLCGLQIIEDNNFVYSVAIGGGYNGENTIPPYLPTESGALCIYNGNCGYTIENTMYWKPIPSNHCTENTLNQNPTLNVSGWQWCEELNGFSVAETQQYLDAMNAYEQQYPNVTFVYMTSNAMAGGEPGYNRHMRCDQIREYCATNHKVLFDFEDLDSWYNGEHYTYSYNGTDVPYMHPAYGGNDCGHANELNSLNKGKAVWYMMALIRDWDPTAFTNNIPVIEPQSFTLQIQYPNPYPSLWIPVGQIIASDPDIGQSISFLMTQGNQAKIIVDQSGKIFYNSLSAEPIGIEEDQTIGIEESVSKYKKPQFIEKYNIMVQVSDNFNPPASSTAAIDITVYSKTINQISWWVENDILFFKFPFENEDFGKVVLNDSFGNTVYTGWCYPGTNQINVSTLTGLYMFTIVGGETGKVISTKIIIQ